MKKKYLLVLLAFMGASASIPALRVRVAPIVTPALDAVGRLLSPVLGAGLNPVYRWTAVNETRTIARGLRTRNQNLWSLPTPQQFPAWLEKQHFTGRGNRDPWGTPYWMIAAQDSFVVLSAGPDREPGTADDVRGAAARH